jgi:hypothetical protein
MKDNVLKGFLYAAFIFSFVFSNGTLLKGQENIALIADSLLTSHVSTWEDLNAINDGFEPANSMDHSHGAYGNWQSGVSNQWNWVQYNFDQYCIIGQTGVYWWTDQIDTASTVGVQIPYDCYLEYWDIISEVWVEVKNPAGYGIERNKYNVTNFDPVLTDKIRLHFVSVSAQGIIEWKVFGILGEQIPSHSIAGIDQPLIKNDTHTVTVTARDKNDLLVEGYIFRVDASLFNQLNATPESYFINGIKITSDTFDISLPPTNASGIVTFQITTPPVIDPTDGIQIAIQFNDGLTTIANYSLFEPGLAPPDLHADTSENNVDHALEIEFTDDPAWRSAITAVIINGSPLTENTDYVVETGKLILTPSGGNATITASGLKSITLEAPGYENATIIQEILCGAVSAEKSGFLYRVKLYKGATTAITLVAKDTYNNFIEGYHFKWDASVFDTTAVNIEVYQVDTFTVSGVLADQELPATDNDGNVIFKVIVPSRVDLNDGIEIQVQLNDGFTDVDSLIRYIAYTGEKQVYIANDLKNHDDWSWDKTAQSDNFVLFWGDLTGSDPLNPVNNDNSIVFDPSKVLEKLERYLALYVDTLNFITNKTEGNMAKYKFIIVICNTWADRGYEGWATGGSWDDVIGAMWIHPGATGGSGNVIAHEFGHMCQAMIPIQYPGHGLRDKSGQNYVGMFWESHANFLALTATHDIGSVQPERWVNTAMMHYSSTRHYYQAVYFPQYIADKYGMEEVNLIWRNALPGDHPLESFKRNRAYAQEQLNDEFGYCAMKNVTWDYSNGELIRNYLRNQVDPAYVGREFTILDTIQGKPGFYIVPRYLAPGDYGYNIIPLYPVDSSNTVTVKFSGYDNEPAGGAGWRYGFVATDGSGNPRYSDLYADQQSEVSFTLNAGDKELCFVVTGAPKTHHNYVKWEPGYPKIYRYPYNLQFEGALPAGHLPGYNSLKNDYPGAQHANGGGWIASTAMVDASVYVGPDAQVLGKASVKGSARIEDYAIVTDNAQVSGFAIIRGHSIVGKDAKVRGNAIVEKTARVYNGCNIYENAIITGSALAYRSTVREHAIVKDLAIIDGASLSGDIIVGGDAEDFGSCSTGTYLQLFKITGRSGCDGIHDHSLNINVNPEISDYPLDTLVRVPSEINETDHEGEPYIIYYRTEDHTIVLRPLQEQVNIKLVRLLTIDGRILTSIANPSTDVVEINIPAKGMVIIMIVDDNGTYSDKIFIP